MAILQDVLGHNLRVVFCGTAVGAASARLQAYYAGPGNRFWPTLFEIGLTPRQLEPAEYRSIAQFGLGLTDLAKSIAGADTVLKDGHFDRGDLLLKIELYQPQVLAFTSKRAAEEYLGEAVGYGRHSHTIGETAVFVLPSPSGAARRYWSIQPWRDLARETTFGN
jgi:double-stranded uracil-DNA glycosylase